MEQILQQAKRAKQASEELALWGAAAKQRLLEAMAAALEAGVEDILRANRQDLARAEAEGRGRAFLDRLALDPARIADMAAGLRQVAMLPDPVGEVLGGGTMPSGIRVVKRRVPFGVVGMIYEARPNVTIDAIGICLKTGNAVHLKVGREALCSNIALAEIAEKAGRGMGLPAGAIELVRSTDRAAAAYLMTLREYIDVLIPRGGAGLIRTVVENARVPVIETGVGNCHVYVDASADLEMAVDIVLNAKASRPSVCNAIENLLVHRDIAETFLPVAAARLSAVGVELRGCPRCREIVSTMRPATEEDYRTEFLDYILAVKVVDSMEEAVAHINAYGTRHSEAIVTRDLTAADYFQQRVDAAAVYVNASTRFTDGGEFGFGAEIGISTQKLHARGPMGLAEMTTYKYLIAGDGQVR